MAEPRIDLERVERDWTARGYTFGRFTDLPGREWKDYAHSTDEVMMVVEGEVEVELAGRKFTARPGEEINIPAGEPHSIRNVGPSVARWINGYKRMLRGGG
ncbi:MAG: cupin domain-containing protein [bacterium]